MNEGYAAFLANRRELILSDVREALRRAGRPMDSVEIVAVSKTVGAEEVEAAYGIGWRLFGENRPQELVRKTTALDGNPGCAGIVFDMIGNLQKNKINMVLGNAELVHSVSSVHLAEAISTRAAARGMRVRCLLETNVSGEGSKSGVGVDDAPAAADAIMGMEGIELEGLMTMAPAYDLDAARTTFCGLRELRDDLRLRTGLALDVLSCGMSDDFEVAIEEGSTLVRLGRIVFDPAYEDT